MNSKPVIPDFFVQRKKRKFTHSSPNSGSAKCVNETESTFLRIKILFPVKELCNRLPPVILVHQVYSIIKNRTAVDKEINGLVEKGIIRLFKLGMKETTIVAIFSEDFNKHVLGRICPCQVESNSDEFQEELQSPTITKQLVHPPLNNLTVENCRAQCSKSKNSSKESRVCLHSQAVVRFIYEVMPMIQDVSVDKELLQKKYNFREEDIRTLMNVGLLVVRSVGSYWLSFPNAGEFMKHFSRGRATLIRLIKKCKFSEILQPELEKRQLEKTAKFGIQYHMHDLIGGDFVECIETTSGTLLRIPTVEKK